MSIADFLQKDHCVDQVESSVLSASTDCFRIADGAGTDGYRISIPLIDPLRRSDFA